MSRRAKLAFWGATDLGQTRTHNEDSLCLPGDTDDLTGRGWLFAVADGVGGHAAGEVASHLMVEELREYYRSPEVPAPPLGVYFTTLFRDASRHIHAQGASEVNRRGMGTTCTVACFRDVGLTVAHVGDSRLYRLRRARLAQLTEDETEVQALLKAGMITPAEAAVHPRRHVLYQCIGQPDLHRVYTSEEAVQAGDRYLLCTDGLHGPVPDEQIAATLAFHPEPGAAGGALIVAANDAGGRDNITVIVVDVGCVDGAAG